MQYKYYDPPLDLFPGRDNEHPEAVKLRNELIKLEDESFRNFDETIARYEYEIQFGYHVRILYDKNRHIIEGPDLGKLALCRGGSVAVYRECIKQNATVDQLLGITDFRYPGEEEFVFNPKTGEYDPAPYTSGISLKEAYGFDLIPDFGDDDEAAWEAIDNLSDEDVIAYIKKKREEALELQRQRQQSQ